MIPPTADTTTTVFSEADSSLTIFITLIIFFEEPTDVPPNFKTFILLFFIFNGNYCFGINNINRGERYIIAKPKRVIIVIIIITKIEFVWKDSINENFVELVVCCIILCINSQKYQIHR